MESVRQELLHKTAVEIEALSQILTRERFIELTGKIPVDLLDQTQGENVLEHLRLLSIEYHNNVNDIIETLETEEYVNARKLAEDAARRIVSRRSREIWSPNKV